MIDELIVCPFERAVVGGKGHILLRRNTEHAELAARAIRRREPPAWSSQRVTYEVAA